MAAKKRTALLVKLASTAKFIKIKADGTKEEKSSGYFYVKKRNPKKLVNKLSFRKYDPIVKRHVLFEEQKLK